MATYIEMRTDGFRKNLDALEDSSLWDFSGVRRPHRGIEIKEDTYAMIKVIRSDGSEIPLVDSGSRRTPSSRSIQNFKNKSIEEAMSEVEVPAEGSTFHYSNFIAQQIVDSREEKRQIVETFGDPYIFFYGEQPRLMSVSGVLINTFDFNWKNEFWKNYERYLRGTKLVELDARVYFYFDDQIVEGYLLGASASHSADNPYSIPFQFTLFVTAHTYLDIQSENGLYPISANVEIPADNLRSMDNVDSTIKKLRERMNKLRPDDLLSTTWIVQKMAEKAAGGVIGQRAIMGAVISGMSDFEAKTVAFFDNIKTYFYGRRMSVPVGFAGGESLTSRAEYANKAIAPGEPIKRTLPLRSRISDNVDEYVGPFSTPLPSSVMEEEVSMNDIYEEDFERVLLAKLAQLGVDISDPSPAQNWRAEFTHTLTKTADKVDFYAGLGSGTITSLKSLALNFAQIGSSFPGILKGHLGVAKQAAPFYIP